MWSFLNFCMKLHQQKFVKLLFWAKSFFKIFEPHSARMDPKWALLRFMENGPSEFFRLFCSKLQIDFNNFFGRILDLRFFGPKEAQKGLKTTFFKLKSYPWIFSDFFGWSYSSIMTENWNEWYFWRNIFDFLHWLKIFLGRKFVSGFFVERWPKMSLFSYFI